MFSIPSPDTCEALVQILRPDRRRTPRAAAALLASGTLALALVAAPAAVAADDPGAPVDGFRHAGPDVLLFGDDDVTGPTRGVTGELERVVSDRPDGTTRTSYLLTGEDGLGRPVSFGGETVPESASAGTLTARVTRSGAVRTARVETADEQATPAAGAPVAERAYVAVLSNQGAYADPDAGIQETVRTALGRWQTESNGRMSSFALARYEPFTTSTDCSSGSAMWNEAVSQAYPGVSFDGSSGNHLIVLAPKKCGGGVGTVGSEANGIASGGKLSVNYDPAKNQTSLLHELGHNFSLQHANAAYCSADGASGCGDHEYGNHYAFMGVSVTHTPAYDPASLDSFERARLGLLDAGEVATAQVPSGESGTTASYALRARGGTTGLRGVRVVDPSTGEVYWVDWRDASGRDASAYYADTGLSGQQTNAFLPGVTVEKQISGGDQSELQSYRKPAPSQGYLFGYTAGGTFRAGATTISVSSIGTTANVAVTLGTPTAPTPPAPPAPKRFTSIPTPVVDATHRVGQYLGVDVRQRNQQSSRWSPSAQAFRYDWRIAGTTVDRTTGPRMRITAGMVGKRVNCLVTATRTGYTPGRVYSTLSRTITR